MHNLRYSLVGYCQRSVNLVFVTIAILHLIHVKHFANSQELVDQQPPQPHQLLQQRLARSNPLQTQRMCGKVLTAKITKVCTPPGYEKSCVHAGSMMMMIRRRKRDVSADDDAAERGASATPAPRPFRLASLFAHSAHSDYDGRLPPSSSRYGHASVKPALSSIFFVSQFNLPRADVDDDASFGGGAHSDDGALSNGDALSDSDAHANSADDHFSGAFVAKRSFGAVEKRKVADCCVHRCSDEQLSLFCCDDEELEAFKKHHTKK